MCLYALVCESASWGGGSWNYSLACLCWCSPSIASLTITPNSGNVSGSINNRNGALILHVDQLFSLYQNNDCSKITWHQVYRLWSGPPAEDGSMDKEFVHAFSLQKVWGRVIIPIALTHGKIMETHQNPCCWDILLNGWYFGLSEDLYSQRLKYL